ILRTNLIIIKQKYIYSRQQIIINLFYLLSIIFANRPSALLNLRYYNIIMTLLRDLNSKPYRILIEFIYEFIKKFLTKNIFPVSKIIFNPSLILNLHVAFLSLIFADIAF
ncbi:hypothetical protein BKA65DRAFT_356653, partial [Rhexocercosporidium sp. MPI-PUGE-AT-0058]